MLETQYFYIYDANIHDGFCLDNRIIHILSKYRTLYKIFHNNFHINDLNSSMEVIFFFTFEKFKIILEFNIIPYRVNEYFTFARHVFWDDFELILVDALYDQLIKQKREELK